MSEETEVAAVEQQQDSVEVSLIDEIIQSTNVKPEDDAYDMTMQGIQAIVNQISSQKNHADKVTKALVDNMIANIDQQISAQLDEILHHNEFQEIESLWRSLQFLVDRTDFRENNKIEILNATKSELLEDFDDAPEVTKSGLYKLVYTKEYGQFGGEPYGAIIGNYDFGPGAMDIKLLGYIGSVAAMAHAPFIASAAPSMFGLESFNGLPELKDLSSTFEGPQFAKWRSLRESEDARYIGLTLPRFLLRLPYGKDNEAAKSFNYSEDVSDDNQDFLWGNMAFAFSSKISDSFSKYRWCANIIGPQSGGSIEDLPLHHFDDMGAIQTKIPTEILLSERREFELAEEGFIGLTMRKGADNAAFFSANSIQKPMKFPNTAEGKDAETNFKLGTQLPYMFIINRLAHYLKVIQREGIGKWKEKVDLQKELNEWIRSYVVDMDNPMDGVRSRRPLRKAEITVDSVAGEPGWYRVGLKVKPHFKYMGASFTLSLVGKLETE